MRRPVLLTLAAVGGVIVLLGGTGIFAALSDTARSGSNAIETQPLAPSSDLQVASATGDLFTGLSCQAFSENLTSGLITIGTAGGGFVSQQENPYCVRNVGSKTVSLFVGVEAFDDVEVGCTGDEALYDGTCGAGVGEIGDNTAVAHAYYDEASPDFWVSAGGGLLRDGLQTPSHLVELSPGETVFLVVGVYVNPSNDELQAQRAQSDRLTWRFVWTGQA
jgi:hypothetical protein